MCGRQSLLITRWLEYPNGSLPAHKNVRKAELTPFPGLSKRVLAADYEKWSAEVISGHWRESDQGNKFQLLWKKRREILVSRSLI